MTLTRGVTAQRPTAAVIYATLWTGLWFTPWGNWLRSWPWLGTALALALFVAPGMGLHAWSTRGMAVRVSGRVTYGFALSVALTGTIGLIACVLHLSFAFVLAILWGAGLLGAFGVARWELPPAAAHDDRKRLNFVEVVLMAVLLVLAARLALSPAGGSDAATHVARLTGFQQSTALGFSSVGFGDAVQIPPRYWLAYWPLCEAVLAALSGLHGLELTSVYLAPLLAPLALASTFELSVSLGLSRRLAVSAVAAQVVSLVLLGGRTQPGQMFFNHLCDDNVLASYVLAPVATAAVARFLRAGRGLSLVGSTYLGLAVTHPTVFGFAYLVTVAYSAAELLGGVSWRRIVPALVVSTLLIAGVSTLRLVDHPSQQHVYFSVAAAEAADEMIPTRWTRLWVSADHRTYAVARQVVPPAARVAALMALAAALVQFRRVRAARYVVAVVGLAELTLWPQTSWLIGMLITPFHLWRVWWQVPFGIGLVVVAGAMVTIVRLRQRLRSRLTALGPWGELVFVGALVAVMIVTGRPNWVWALHLPPDWRTVAYAEGELQASAVSCRRTFADLIAIGRAIDTRAPNGAVVVGDVWGKLATEVWGTNDFIPSVSTKARLVVFRSDEQTAQHGGVSLTEARRRIVRLKQVFDDETPAAERLRILDEFGVEYVVSCGEWPVPSALAAGPSAVRLEETAGNLHLYRLARFAPATPNERGKPGAPPGDDA
ncbi:MAG: hypothetical protein HYR72_13365 [Deltaproteobacteria bacterium]|nr:hypothetical protein [Deltaproteobacteria bacterium]MBI3386900.1 hypothetical protein [Deltaproteobacteria bacterium]